MKDELTDFLEARLFVPTKNMNGCSEGVIENSLCSEIQVSDANNCATDHGGLAFFRFMNVLRAAS